MIVGGLGLKPRAATRLAAKQLVEAHSNGRRWAAILCNVSTAGCALQGPNPGVAAGDTVRIRVKDLTVLTGEIVWAKACALGVKFKDELNPALVMFCSFKDSASLTVDDLRHDQVDGSIPVPQLLTDLILGDKSPESGTA